MNPDFAYHTAQAAKHASNAAAYSRAASTQRDPNLADLYDQLAREQHTSSVASSQLAAFYS